MKLGEAMLAEAAALHFTGNHVEVLRVRSQGFAIQIVILAPASKSPFFCWVLEHKVASISLSTTHCLSGLDEVTKANMTREVAHNFSLLTGLVEQEDPLHQMHMRYTIDRC